MRCLFRLPPSRSAQVRLSLPRSIPTCRFSQVLPGNPGNPQNHRKSLISWEDLGGPKNAGNNTQVLPGPPRKLMISCDFVGFRDFLGEPGCYFLRFCGFPGFPGRTWVLFSAFLLVSGISWENLGVIFCAFVGFPGFPGRTWVLFSAFFPTCQVRVVRFYVSCLLLLSSSPLLLVVLLVVLLVQLRPAIHSVLCRTSTTTIHAQCSLPDLNHDHPRPVFPAGPQPRPSTPSVPCRTSTASIHAQCSLPDSTASIHAKCSLPDLM